MRPKIFQLLFLLILLIGSTARAFDTSEEEKACLGIGFKNKSPAFGSCVLELLDRKSMPVATSMEDQTCQQYGFRMGTSEFAMCKQQIDVAKQTAQMQIEQYHLQKRQYDEQIELQRDRDRREKSQRALDLSLRLMNGQSPTDAVLSTGSGQPIPPRVPIPHTVILPNGRAVTCTTHNNVTNCF